MPQIPSFAAADRFLAEISSPEIRPGYILAGDEAFLQQRCRAGVLATLAPPDERDFCLFDLDLAETSIFDALERARTPSLMAPFQTIFVRNLKLLYTRGAKKEEFAAIDAYFRHPNPQALLLFVADHLHLPHDLRRMEMQDRERFDRIRETLGDWCGLVELARIDASDAARWLVESAPVHGATITPDAARELVDALGADMLQIANELEKLALYVDAKARLSHLSNLRSGPDESFALSEITLADVETQVLAAKQRSLYELTDAISLRDRPAALLLLHGLLNASDGGEDSAIGHLYLLARSFRQMLIILEKNVRDSRGVWQALWPGFRMPPFAVDDLIRQARRYRARTDLTRALRLIARADLEIRSSPPDKRLVLERLILALTSATPLTPDLA